MMDNYNQNGNFGEYGYEEQTETAFVAEENNNLSGVAKI